MAPNSDKYQNIRPYNDREVPASMARLIADKEFIDAILHHQFQHMSLWLLQLLRPVLRLILKWKWRKFKTVAHLQMEVGRFMRSLLEKTTDGINVSGLEKLSSDESYLFISNHRDIAMDPALVNYALFKEGLNTALIAFGDNLLKKPCATELMKLNKGFIVNRSAKGPREMLKAFTQLSNYIGDSLASKQSIWIAQREGRAKDGMDFTDPAILKMFHMAGKQQKIPFADYMQSLNIVPVAISYENDPCDLAKANELYEKAHQGEYNKSEFEDIDNIVKGIVGFKGRITVAFGDVITQKYDTPQALAQEIDRQIHSNYHLYPVNYLAADKVDKTIDETSKRRLQEKLAQLPAGARQYLISNYANPVKNAG